MCFMALRSQLSRLVLRVNRGSPKDIGIGRGRAGQSGGWVDESVDGRSCNVRAHFLLPIFNCLTMCPHRLMRIPGITVNLFLAFGPVVLSELSSIFS